MKKDTALEVKKDFDKQLAKAIPAWVPEKENIGTSMYESAQELILVVHFILTKHFQFTEDDLKKFTAHLELILKGVSEYEKVGFNLLSPNSIKAVADLVETRMKKNQLTSMGMDYPFLPGSEDLLKKIASPKK